MRAGFIYTHSAIIYTADGSDDCVCGRECNYLTLLKTWHLQLKAPEWSSGWDFLSLTTTCSHKKTASNLKNKKHSRFCCFAPKKRCLWMCCSTLNMLQTKKHSCSPFFGTVSLPSNDLCKYYFGLHFTLMFKKKRQRLRSCMRCTLQQHKAVAAVGDWYQYFGETSCKIRPVKFHI